MHGELLGWDVDSIALLIERDRVGQGRTGSPECGLALLGDRQEFQTGRDPLMPGLWAATLLGEEISPRTRLM